jgi:hypothetical protein
MVIFHTGNTSGSRRKCVTSDILAVPMAFWQCHYPSNIPRSAYSRNHRYQSNICAAYLKTKLEKRKFEICSIGAVARTRHFTPAPKGPENPMGTSLVRV